MLRLVDVLLVGGVISITTADIAPILNEQTTRIDLQLVVIDLLNGIANRNDVTCVTIVTDDVYLDMFEGALYKRMYTMPFVTILVKEHEDLLSPNYHTLKSIRQANKEGCNVYAIILANGFQVTRLLKFGDRHRLLDTRAKYIVLHDLRLFHSEQHYIWKRIINVIFIKYHKKIHGVLKSKTWFDLSTVPFPNPIQQILVPRRVDIWRNGKFHYGRQLFADKTGNLNGEVLDVVYLKHTPSVVVVEANGTNSVSGVEIEILNTLAHKMNFKPKLFQPVNAELAKWGEKQPNGSFSGLLGEMVNGKAVMALGNLQYTPYILELADLSIPYTSQCWTFLTREALTDNSWKTLILPFKLYMWIAVLLVLLVTGSIFHGLAYYYSTLLNYRENLKSSRSPNIALRAKPVGLYLFNEITNSILYTYGMLLVVSLPKLPSGWSIRLLTGWYWLYCILLVVSYRASMTAILANPAPRVTIDTLKELVDSKLTCGGWGSETKRFFQQSLDENGQKIGEKFEIIDNPDEAAIRVAQGVFAYYDNANFLKYLSVKRKNSKSLGDMNNNATWNNTDSSFKSNIERDLHIMSDCVVNAPISIGFHKNSPLKPLADQYLQQIVEVGLVVKWLNDAMYTFRSLDSSQDEIKALMNLKKMYCAFIGLAFGYIMSLICFIIEYIHWNLIIKRDPHFDKYNVEDYFKKNKKIKLI